MRQPDARTPFRVSTLSSLSRTRARRRPLRHSIAAEPPMNKLFAAFLALFLVAPGPVARAQIQPVEPLDRIVAIAEDDVILQSELDRAVTQIQAQIQHNNPQQLPPMDVLRSQMLDRLIMNRLQIQRGHPEW